MELKSSIRIPVLGKAELTKQKIIIALKFFIYRKRGNFGIWNRVANSSGSCCFKTHLSKNKMRNYDLPEHPKTLIPQEA